MNYLRVTRFWEYQNADAWKKARANKGGHRHPAWCKLYVSRDPELDCQKPIVRLVFYELLRLATIHENAILNQPETIMNAISVPRKDVAEALDILLKGGWLSQSKTPRRSREPSRKILPQIEIERREEYTSSSNGYVLPDIALHKLLRVLTDKDEDTEAVMVGIAYKRRLPEAAFGWALDCAQGPNVNSPVRVAVDALKKWRKAA